MTTDNICLIDRYEHSPTRGEMAGEKAVLWTRPHNWPHPDKVKGALAHGDEVEILDSKFYKKAEWYKVRCDKYPTVQQGWLYATMLEKAGLTRPGMKAIEDD